MEALGVSAGPRWQIIIVRIYKNRFKYNCLSTMIGVKLKLGQKVGRVVFVYL